MFGMDLGEIIPDHGEMERWNQQEAAVDCWFTSDGKMMPLRMKCREGDQIIRIEPIRVLKVEENRYAGVLVRLFHCKGVLRGTAEQEFALLFYVERCQWKVSVQEQIRPA